MVRAKPDVEQDLHTPHPLHELVLREVARTAADLAASLQLRLRALSRASYVHPRSRLVDAANIDLGDHVQVHAGATLRGTGTRHPGLSMGRYTIIRENAYVDAHGGWIELRQGVFAGQNAVIYGQGGVTVGANTLLAPGVTLVAASHLFSGEDRPIKFQPEDYRGITIGANCWLGANAVVLDGVTIGSGCVVGAGAVVTRDLASGSVAYGVPAEIRRSRLQS
ncbi:MAG TPA: acyltransferase [Chloroflexota bacterium]|nr:acyltransferase [Chloroflexota bacterium]